MLRILAVFLAGTVLASCGADSFEDVRFWTASSTSGELTLELTSEVAGNRVGLHEYTLVVLDQAGARVTDLNISIEPWMPDHGHGSDRPVEVNEKNNSDAE